jgi:hypothetical protein
METHIRLSSGQVIEVASRLLSSPVLFDIELPDSFTASHDAQFATLLLKAAQCTADHKLGAQKALQAAEMLAQYSELESSLLALATYASHVGALETNADIITVKLGVLVDAASLVHGALPYCQSEVVAQLTQIIARLVEDACFVSALVDPSQLTDVGGDVQAMLSMAAVAWGPDLADIVSDAERAFDDLLVFVRDSGSEDDAVRLQESIARDLRNLSLRVSGRAGGRRMTLVRLGLIQTLLTAWKEAAHRCLIIRQTNQSQSKHRGKEAGFRVAEVELIIEQVETALRDLLTQKYRQQYGDEWSRHVEAKHPQMYSYWVRNMERDQAAFKTYLGHKPELLEYARLEDLKELIAAQWHLFREIFDFGQGDRNKMLFSDKMEQIARVRNPLAHHRSVPGNELLRAQVLCTDILLALERRAE